MDILSLALIFESLTKEFKLPDGLLSSICYIESHHNPNAVHHDDGRSDSLGLCQIKLETAKWLGFKGTKQQLMNPKTNAYYAGKYLKRNISRYQGDVTKAIIAYNQGSAKNLTSTKYSRKVISKWRGNKCQKYCPMPKVLNTTKKK